MTLTTMPPWRSTGAFISWITRPIAALQSSGSSRSAMAVESTTSANNAVTNRRSAIEAVATPG